MTIPDKHKSLNQKYVISEKGLYVFRTKNVIMFCKSFVENYESKKWLEKN